MFPDPDLSAMKSNNFKTLEETIFLSFSVDLSLSRFSEKNKIDDIGTSKKVE